jgi:hypothetical protein
MNELNEAIILSKYLLGQGSSEQEDKLYHEAMTRLNILLTGQEAKVWKYMMTHPRSVPYIDAALALTKPNGNIRRKIFVMLAILEASPTHSDQFLPLRFNSLYFFKVMYSSIRSVLRALTGIILLKLVR